MTERVLGPTGGRRRKRLALLLPFLALAALILAIGASAGPVGIAAGFEGDDGNLVDASGSGIDAGIDWNTFKPTTWTGTVPYQAAEKSVSGWKFVGIADAQNDGDDTAFAGGTKQDDECAAVKAGPKPPNKDDLERIYLASRVKTVGTTDTVYLALAWVRIPQNTTSASAHVAFEFNQLDPDVAANQCGGDSDGLVKRSTANGGDMLIVYDFEGGTELPQIKLLRWIGSGACEVGSSSPPCWGNAQLLTVTGFADAKVNVGATALDEIAPTSETLNDSEFGEAIIDLTGAGVFPTVGCLTFGSVFGVSRSSGNSQQAAMKDLVGPGDSGLSNCGKIELVKDFVGAPTNARANLRIDKGGTTTLVAQLADAADLGTTGEQQVRAGAYDISETQGTNTLFSNYSTTVACVDEAPNPDQPVTPTVTSLTGTGTTARTATGIQVPVGGDVVCTFTNTLLTGAIKVTKTGGDKRCLGAGNPDATCVSAGVRRLTGVTFQLKKGSTVIGNMAETSTTGVYCTQGLGFGTDYTIQETAAPAGYTIDNGAVSSAITVNSSSTCASGAVNAGTYTNTPVSKIQVKFFPPAAGVTVASIDCGTTTAGTELSPTPADSDEGTGVLNDSDETYESLAPGTYYCKVVIDP